MIEYERGQHVYNFEPLPASKTTARLYLGMAALTKGKKGQGMDMSAIAEVIGMLPECIARSMRTHPEEEVNAFIDTVVLDFGNPESLSVLSDLNMLFMGIDPAGVMKQDAVPVA